MQTMENLVNKDSGQKVAVWYILGDGGACQNICY